MVREEEVFLPAHEDVLALRDVRDVEVALAGLSLEGTEGLELGPVLEVDLVGRAPVFVLGEEGVFGADDFAFEVGRERWVVFGEACVGMWLALGMARSRGGWGAPCMRRYPHRNDSRMSTCFISTCTS
jgi:hypothetical protein